MKENTFGYKKYKISDIVRNENVTNLVWKILSFQFKTVTGKNSEESVRKFLDLILSKGDVSDYELASKVKGWALDMIGGEEGMSKLKRIRIEDIISSFKRFQKKFPFRIDGNVVDIGCGNGLVVSGIASSEAESIELADVVDYVDDSLKKLKFTLIPKSGKLPYEDNQFDSVVVVTTLHHASNPKELLFECIRICGGRLFIMETLVNVNNNMRTEKKQEGKERKELSDLENVFSNLAVGEQMMHASFQDWFYNDVVQGGVDVPLNFGSDEQWQNLFSEFGVKLAGRSMVGIDQRTSGEYHVIYVCEKEK